MRSRFVLVLGAFGAILVASGSAAARSQTLTSQNIAVAVVIDNSGSNVATDPGGLRFAAARQLVDLLEPGDEFAAIIFSADVRVPVALTHIADGADRTRIHNLLNSREPESDTNMVPALDAARAELEKASNTRRIIVFLTDGELSPPGNVDLAQERQRLVQLSQSIGNAGAHIYTIGLSTEIDPNLLAEVAKGGRGVSLSAPTAELISPRFQQIFELEGLTTVKSLFGDTIAPGQILELPFPVHRFVRTLSLFVTPAGGAELESTLTDPSGVTIAPEVGETAYIAYRVEGPRNGRWTLRLRNAGTRPVPISITDTLRADVAVSWVEPGNSVPVDVPTRFTVHVTGRLPTSGAEIPVTDVYDDLTAELSLQKSDGTVGPTVRLEQAGSGDFSGETSPLAAGEWEAHVTIASPKDDRLAESRRSFSASGLTRRYDLTLNGAGSVAPGKDLRLVLRVATAPPLSAGEASATRAEFRIGGPAGVEAIEAFPVDGVPGDYAADYRAPSTETKLRVAGIFHPSQGDAVTTAERTINVAPPPGPPYQLYAGLIAALAAGLVALYYFVGIARFPRDARLAFAGDPTDYSLRDKGGFALRRQHIVIGGPQSRFDLGLDAPVAELRATRSADGALVDPVGNRDLQMNDVIIEEATPLRFGSQLRGRGWQAEYREKETYEADDEPPGY